jgi:hypothetical protein
LISERLNGNCFCVTLNKDALDARLAEGLGSTALLAMLKERCPYLFSARPVFISDSQVGKMSRLVRAVEVVAALPAYRDFVLSGSPAIARHDPGGASSVFFGYDFHLVGDRIGLIEINTNAGGAMLNSVVARAHHACCMDDERLAAATASAASLDQRIVDMFIEEWRLSGRRQPLRTIAIVDAAPQEQYLYPEFLLFQNLFERHGLKAIIADPADLKFRDGLLWAADVAIDLVYNRLTDFMLEAPSSAALRAAYLENAVLLTPHPQAHALYADKRNLAILSDREQLKNFGAPQDCIDVLAAHVLRTEVVDAARADELWRRRRQLFFKPSAGYGSKAAYRGDKLTKRVFEEILQGNYVAQDVMLPGERVAGSRAAPESLKFDIRCYAYRGAIQWTAARLYQGQTTNFRTPEGIRPCLQPTGRAGEGSDIEPVRPVLR